MNNLRVLICPDAFKGTLSAPQVTAAIARGVARVHPSAQLDRLLLSDGGPGTLNAIAAAVPSRFEQVSVRGPLGQRVDASYLRRNDGSCVVEVAQAVALTLLDPTLVTTCDRMLLRASTFGVGQLLRAALDHAPVRIVVTLGGSGTNDAGYGFAQALGFRLRDAAGAPLPMPSRSRQIPELLAAVASIDSSTALTTDRATSFLAATDVDNPLCGPAGATRVYGPQKGIGVSDLNRMDDAIAHFARVIKRDCGIDVVDLPGAGAAGGLGAALVAFCGARLTSGFDWVAETVDLDAHLKAADLVITGEGRLDGQTAHGKTVMGVARRARALGRQVFAIAGTLATDRATLDRLGIDRAYASCPEASPQAGLATADDVTAAAERAARDYQASRPR